MSDFGWALDALHGGRRVTRLGWNGKGQYLELQKPDEHSKMARPYIYISPVGGRLVPWVASQTDLLAVDWDFAGPAATAAQIINERKQPAPVEDYPIRLEALRLALGTGGHEGVLTRAEQYANYLKGSRYP